MKSFFLILSVSFLFFSCEKEDLFDINEERIPQIVNAPVRFADANLNREASNLYDRLINSSQTGIAFGQQEPNGTGFNSISIDDQGNPIERSEITENFFRTAGDHQVIVGFDLEGISFRSNDFFDSSSGLPALDNFIDKFSKRVIELHEKGSIITFSWHYTNPRFSNSQNFNGVVSELLEGGIYRQSFLENLSKVAQLFKKLVDKEGKPIPVLFRPWHEMNGDFFFWGEGFRTTEEYIQLWQDTVNILSEDLGVHNLIYIYAPNFVTSRSEYLKNYPGDEFVDFLGIDVYDFRNGKFLNTAIRNLKIVEEIANEKNMLFALTETGFFRQPGNNWYLDKLYKAIRSSAISYAMVWRNEDNLIHVPYSGHSSEQSFNEFIDKEIILLSEEVQ